jgi:hypothetical protein
MDSKDVLRDIRRQIENGLEEEITKKECLLTCMLLEWLMRNEIISSVHVEMFIDEQVGKTIANREGLINEELLEKGHV